LEGKKKKKKKKQAEAEYMEGRKREKLQSYESAILRPFALSRDIV
jgi:hypothetical protein